MITKDGVKKALAQCSDNCIGCPYKPLDMPCQYQLKKDALDLITEQEKEIERLKQALIDNDLAKEILQILNNSGIDKATFKKFLKEHLRK